MSAGAAVEVRGLVKRFGRFTAVDGLDLTVARGTVHGFLGPNGAGKSTTLRVLLGVLRADAGQVRVLGQDPAATPAVTTRISYVPGDSALWPSLTGQQVIDALAGLRGRHDVAAERRLVRDFALDPSRRIRASSKGNRQKVLLVAAFAARTELLVLDEPTSGLDPLMEEVFQQCVRDAVAEGRTVLLSSHVLGEVERLCTDVTIVKDGRPVEAGALVELRHLAASTVTAVLPPEQVAGASAEVARLTRAPETVACAGDRIEARVPEAEVAAVLRVLLDHGGRQVTCMPATLEELFLRHYEVAAR